MAPRRGALESPEPEGLTSLAFDRPLSWRAGKPIATGELHKSLDILSRELRDMDQDGTDKSSLQKIAGDLVSQNLLAHKNKGVKAFVACCLVDILRICAPDAPFTQSQLKDIYTVFVTAIIPALSDPSNAYNDQHKYVLVSLSEVKSVILLTDLPNSDQLLLHLFTTVFDIVSGSSKSSTDEQVGKDVQYHMTSILVTLVDEAAQIQNEVVDIIMAQFLRALPGEGKKGEVDDKQSTLLPKELPEAYNTAKTICNSCSDKMTRYVSNYFSDVMINSSPANGTKNGRKPSDIADSDEEMRTGPVEIDLKELKKAHSLLRELWRAAPLVLQNVIPQIEMESTVEDATLRQLATETLGDMIAGIGAAGPPPPPTMDPAVYPPLVHDLPTASTYSSILITPNSPKSFAETHGSAYQRFASRFRDKSVNVRVCWARAVGRILVTQAGGIGLSREDQNALVKHLAEALNDPDEKVRLAAVKAVGGFGLREFMTILAPNGNIAKSGSILSHLADRCRDRKTAVRVEGMTTLGRIWGVAVGEIAAGNESVISALGGIPSKICDTYYTNDQEQIVLLDHVMYEQLIPLSYPPAKAKKASRDDEDGPFDPDRIRTERILLLIQSLDARAKKAFFALQGRQPSFQQFLTLFLQRCEEHNAGVGDNSKPIKGKLDAVIQYSLNYLPDQLKASLDLHKFAKLHDRRSYQLLRFAMNSEKDFKTVHNSIKEFVKRIEAAPGHAGILETMMPLIYRASCLVYNRSHLLTILQVSRNDAKALGVTAREVLNEISERNPAILQANIKDLCNSLVEQASSEKQPNDPGTVESLKACANYARSGKQNPLKEKNFISALLKYASYGTPPKAAKYAVTILVSNSDKREMHAKELLEKSINGWKYGRDHFLTKLATISQLVLLVPSLTGEYHDRIHQITIEEVLNKVRTKEGEKDWQSDLDDECQAKCWSLKAQVNILRSLPDTNSGVEARSVFNLLKKLMAPKDELEMTDMPKHHVSRLRLVAAQMMLKLCTHPMYDKMLTPQDFEKLALVTQEPIEEVRHGFIEKVQKYLVKEKLPNRFYTIVFNTAYEPDHRFRRSIETWLRSRAKAFHDKKLHAMELVLPRLISLLAHHPDHGDTAEELRDQAKYLILYVSTVATPENLGEIYKYAERVKQSADKVHPELSELLYVYSELTQAVIRKWEEKKGWSMQAWAMKVGVSTDLFGRLESHEVAQKIAEKQYLPDKADNLLDGLIRDYDNKKRKSTGDGASEVREKRMKLNSQQAKSTGTKKPEKPARTPKKSRESLSSPMTESANRRKSGRTTGLSKSYADKGSSEDDEQMWDGVASWEYYDDEGNPIAPPKTAAKDASEKNSDESEEKSTPSLPDLEPAEEEPTPTSEKSVMQGQATSTKVFADLAPHTLAAAKYKRELRDKEPQIAKYNEDRLKKYQRENVRLALRNKSLATQEEEKAQQELNKKRQTPKAATKSKAKEKKPAKKAGPAGAPAAKKLRTDKAQPVEDESEEGEPSNTKPGPKKTTQSKAPKRKQPPRKPN